MRGLDYTAYAEGAMEAFERRVYANDDLDVYALLEKGALTAEDVLWYHAFSGYICLCGMPLKNEQIAAEVRRFIFLNRMGGWEAAGRFHLPDGSVYESISDPELLGRMVKLIRRCYEKCRLSSDEGISYSVPRTPSDLMKFLKAETSDRNRLLRLAFVLELDGESFNRFLTSGLYSRRLSAAIPRELIILYCVENANFDWEFVNSLQRAAEGYRREAREGAPVWVDSALLNTHLAQQAWGADLKGMDAETFKENILKPCCALSVRKSVRQQRKGQEVQYSRRALMKMRQNSILRDEAQGIANSTARDDYDGLYSMSIVRGYEREMGVPREYQLCGKGGSPGRIMSLDNYCRFLSYRIVVQGGERRRGIYRMKYGQLPQEIKESVLMHSDIVQLPATDRDMDNSHPHNIKRYMILIARFYLALQAHWSSGGFMTRSREEARTLWQRYFRSIRADLKDTGHADFSQKNPLDAMLRICMYALNPLECYNRIYELDVLRSFSDDPETYSPAHYPQMERIRLALQGLRASGERFAQLDSDYKDACDEFCSRVNARLRRETGCDF